MKPLKIRPEKHLFLCADDYGQNKAINEGIVLLAKNQRINAISCLVNAPDWQKSAEQLKPLKKDFFIGLHLNFTFGRALSTEWQENYSKQFKSLFFLMSQMYLKHCALSHVVAEISAQLKAFKEATGTDPAFIDGHQHVHQLPLIRDALVQIFKQTKLRAFCRNTSNGWQDFFSLTSFPKQQALALLGGISWQRQLQQQKIAANTSFSGLYDFRKATNYRHYFQSFLHRSRHEGLILCHPGTRSTDILDPLHSFRPFELDYFMSEAYLTDLRQANCQLIKRNGMSI